MFSEMNNTKRKKLSSTKEKSPFQTMKGLRSTHSKNVFLGHLNINFLRNTFESVNELIKYTFDAFLLRESKLDSSFPDSQFSIPYYRMIRKDRNKNGGGVFYFTLLKIYLLKWFKAIKKIPGNLEILT